MQREVMITFSVQGYIKQIVQLNNDCDLTPEQIENQLRSGKLATTIQEGGTIDIIDSGFAIGRVVDVDNNCEYEDYEVVELSQPEIEQLRVLGEIVRSFDCENGLPEATFNSTHRMVEIMMGQESASVFYNSIDTSGCFFYLKHGTADSCWKNMMKVAQ